MWFPIILLMVHPTVEQKTDQAMTEAVALYDDLEFEQAIFRFQEMALQDARSVKTKAKIFMWLGMSYGQIGDFEKANRNFEHAARLDPDAAFPRDVSPKLQVLLTDAKELVRREKKKSESNQPAEPNPDKTPPETTPNQIIVVETPPAQDAPAPPSSETKAEAATVQANDNEGGLPILGISGGLLGALGVLGAIGSASFGAAAILFYNNSNDPNTTQVDAVAYNENANIMLWLTGIGGTVAVGSFLGAALCVGLSVANE
jgi:tetratricopeptide (TPR) repeat protein